MKKIAIANNKGGVGKTTTAQSVGACLAKMGYRVLLIDLDSQGNLTTSFGIEKRELTKTSAAYILKECKFEEVAQMGNDILHILPANKDLISKEDTIKAAGNYPFTLKRRLKELVNDYDFVIMDCPPVLGALTKIALVASDYFFVPIEAEFLSYDGLRDFIEFSSEVQEISDCELGGVFVVAYNPKNQATLSRDLVESIQEQIGDKLLSTYIRRNIALSEAQAKGVNIFDYKPEANGAADYQKLTKGIIEKIK